jgi:uncharacterized protein YjeT (DUF2065 family)
VNLSFSDLLAALALVFVLEGMIVFVSPRGLKRLIKRILDSTEGELRFAGLLSMLVGIGILFLVR